MKESDSQGRGRRPHEDLLAWQRSMDVAEEVYRLAWLLPSDEVYALSAQLRRAAVSAPSNISEGAAGRSKDHFRSYLTNAIGSLNELDTQLKLAVRLKLLTATQTQKSWASSTRRSP
jgi:four helix bundle protein